jgi:DDE superfamily endonuclease
LHYSGKKKTHGAKNLVLTQTHTKRVSYLSPNFPGATNDKTLAEHLGLRYPPGTTLRSDLGFEGYRPARCHHLQPKKSLSSRR